MNKLLVPIDGSENALRALRYALKLATHTGASIHILRVYEGYALGERSHAYYSNEELEKPIVDECRQSLIDAKAIATAEAPSVPVASSIVRGELAATIVKQAEELGCDGIIMGTRGLGSIATLLLGSVATKVVAHTKLPVTLIH